MRPGLERREAARQAIKDLHRQLLITRLTEGHDMTAAIKLASDDLQEAVSKMEVGQMIEVTKRECLECEGVAYFTKFVAEPEFCPMCGCDMAGVKIWQVCEDVKIVEVE